MRYWSKSGRRGAECFAEGFVHLGEGGGGIILFCHGKLGVTKDILYFVHLESSLIEEGGTGLAAGVEMRNGFEVELGANVFEGFVGGGVVTDVGEVFDGRIFGDDVERLASEEGFDGYFDMGTGLLLVDDELSVLEALGDE